MMNTTPKSTSKKTVQKEKAIKPLSDAQQLKRVLDALDSAGFTEFVRYTNSPRKIMLHSFLGGIFRGLGILVGMTIVVSFLLWVLTHIVDFPLFGQYFQIILDYIESLDVPQVSPNNNAPIF